MGYQLRRCAEHGAQPGSGEHTTAPADQPASGAAGAAGMSWLWGLVELRLARADPDSAA
jgi:hypothetical protein